MKLKWHNETRKIKELVPTAYNPRKLSDKQYKDIEASLKKFNLAEVPCINLDNQIIAGHQRIKILASLYGLEHEIDVRVPNRQLNKQELDEYLIRSNKNVGDWDFDILKDNFDIADLLDFGFDKDELLKNFLIDEKDIVEDEPPELKETTIVKTGDIWELGKHRIICGDSQNIKIFERLIEDKNIGLVFSSPPYNMNANLYKNYKDNLDSQEYINFNLKVIENTQRFLKGFLFWNISYNRKTRWEFLEIIYKIIKETKLNFLELIVWDKGHAMPITTNTMLTRPYENILLASTDDLSQELDFYFCGSSERKSIFNKTKGRAITNYWRVDTNNSQLKEHKACFPVKLPAKAILLTTNETDFVLDVFLGSGTTLIAAEQTNRVCFGIELDPFYCQLIIDRYINFKKNDGNDVFLIRDNKKIRYSDIKADIK
jgi:site-specific DNA-methyltransferase (adenine-specific)